MGGGVRPTAERRSYPRNSCLLPERLRHAAAIKMLPTIPR